MDQWINMSIIIYEMEQSIELTRLLARKLRSNYGIMMLVFLAPKMMISLEGGVSVRLLCFMVYF